MSLGVILHTSQAASYVDGLLIIQIIQNCYCIEILSLLHTSGSTHCLAGYYKNAPPPSPITSFFLLLTTSTPGLFLSHALKYSSNLISSLLFFILAPNFISFLQTTCLPKLLRRNPALAARPRLVARLRLKRRKLAKRRRPQPRVKRRSVARPERRRIPHTSTKVLQTCETCKWNLLTRCPVLKQVHPDTGISTRAMSILNSFVNGMR